MLYDQTISDTVSLSRVLDAFAYDNEPPEVVLSFLDSYNGSIADILSSSLVKSKICCIDFLHKCSYKQAKWIADNFDCLPLQCRCDLAWQTADMRSGISSGVLFMFKKFLKDLLMSDIQHPYKHGAEKYVSELDDMMFEAAKAGDITCALSACTSRGFEALSPYLDYSLFFSRIFQVDIFDALSTQNKYIFFKKQIIDDFIHLGSHHACETKQETVIDFLMQVFGTKIIDDEVKKQMCSMLLSGKQVSGSTRAAAMHIAETKFKMKGTKKLIDNAKHISSVLLDLAIQGEDNYDAVILYMLLMKKKRLLQEWIDNDPDQVRDNFDIVGLVDAA